MVLAINGRFLVYSVQEDTYYDFQSYQEALQAEEQLQAAEEPDSETESEVEESADGESTCSGPLTAKPSESSDVISWLDEMEIRDPQERCEPAGFLTLEGAFRRGLPIAQFCETVWLPGPPGSSRLVPGIRVRGVPVRAWYPAPDLSYLEGWLVALQDASAAHPFVPDLVHGGWKAFI